MRSVAPFEADDENEEELHAEEPQKELEKAKNKSPSAANRSIPRTIRGAPGSRVRSNPGSTTACSPVFSTVSLSRPLAVEGSISVEFSVC